MNHEHRRNLNAVESAHAENPTTEPPLVVRTEIDAFPTLGSTKLQRLATKSGKLTRQEEQALAEEGMGGDQEVWPPY